MASFFETVRQKFPLPAYDVEGLNNEEQAVVALFFLGQQLKSVMLKVNTPGPNDDLQTLWSLGDALAAQIEEIIGQFGDSLKECPQFTVREDYPDWAEMPVVVKVIEG